MSSTHADIPCSRCLAERSTEAPLDAPCPVCGRTLVSSLRAWERFGARDGRLLAGALLVQVWAVAVGLLPTLVAGVLGAMEDPASLRSGQPSPAVITLGIVGICSALPAMVGAAAWILVLVISFGGVLSRLILPLVTMGGVIMLAFLSTMAGGIAVGIVASASRNVPNDGMQIVGAVSGGVYAAVWYLGTAWAISSLQRSLTRDRTRLGLLWMLAVLSTLSGVATVVAMQFAAEPQLSGVAGTARTVLGLGLWAAFQGVVIERLLWNRRRAMELAKHFASLQFGMKLVTVDPGVPPVFARRSEGR